MWVGEPDYFVVSSHELLLNSYSQVRCSWWIAFSTAPFSLLELKSYPSPREIKKIGSIPWWEGKTKEKEFNRISSKNGEIGRKKGLTVEKQGDFDKISSKTRRKKLRKIREYWGKIWEEFNRISSTPPFFSPSERLGLSKLWLHGFHISSDIHGARRELNLIQIGFFFSQPNPVTGNRFNIKIQNNSLKYMLTWVRIYSWESE